MTLSLLPLIRFYTTILVKGHEMTNKIILIFYRSPIKLIIENRPAQFFLIKLLCQNVKHTLKAEEVNWVTSQ